MSQSGQAKIKVNGSEAEVNLPLEAKDVLSGRAGCAAAKINGQVKDWSAELKDGDEVEDIPPASQDALNIMRHSAAHVMAQAVQDLYPDAKLGVGPVIEDGFYYDFDVDRPFTPEDLEKIEKKMREIISQKQKFVRRGVSFEEAEKEEAGQPYKLELIEDRKGQPLTMYDNVDKTGKVVWKDLCRGPHMQDTGKIGAVKLLRTASAYWKGDEKNPSMQRIYGTAWATKEDLESYLKMREEVAKRDHRKLGEAMDLFSFPTELGAGLAVFHPKGAAVIEAMKDYSRLKHRRNGYSFVQTPHVTKEDLYKTSGHLNWYADSMYPPMHLDELKNEEGEVIRQAQNYYLKPMNCPMHNLIYMSRQRSYKELPLRLFEFGTVYRYEKSGEVQGLTRMRGFTQDDSHIYCTPEQMEEELSNTLNFILTVLRDFGLKDFYLELSTKNPNKYVGSDEAWEKAEGTLRKVAEESGLSLKLDEEGAAFYGPKISVEIKDALGRFWQLSTLQLDFNEPRLFGLEYVSREGEHKEPVMIHRALFGSIERFFAILLEHYAGALPAWLAPTQALLIPVTEQNEEYLSGISKELEAEEIRVEKDFSSDRFGKKIRNSVRLKAPFVLIAGPKDEEEGTVSFRFRDGTQLNAIAKEKAVSVIGRACEDKIQVNTAEDLKSYM
ncbi:MAG: threonine--tRNA ligase [Aeriscardovia sp.]|nr:threonine--tRNA ligase [Aeriscardovia sp.]